MKGLLFTYALTYGGAVVSLVNPFYGLLIYFCFAVVRPEAMWYWSVPAGHYGRVVVIALLIGWAIQGFGQWSFRNAKAILLALLGFIAWMAASVVFAPRSQMAWNAVESLSKIVLPFRVGITLIRSRAQFKQLAWFIC